MWGVQWIIWRNNFEFLTKAEYKQATIPSSTTFAEELMRFDDMKTWGWNELSLAEINLTFLHYAQLTGHEDTHSQAVASRPVVDDCSEPIATLLFVPPVRRQNELSLGQSWDGRTIGTSRLSHVVGITFSGFRFPYLYVFMRLLIYFASYLNAEIVRCLAPPT